MPYSPQDRRHPHLQLVAEDRSPERRRRPAPPTPPPSRGGRAAFAQTLTDRLTNLEGELQQAALRSPGIQPHLVFRIPLAKGAVVDEIANSLRAVGLITVSIEPDRAVIAFRDDADLAEFKTAVAAYRRGPRTNPKTGEPFKSTKWDLFEYIETESMKLWARADRIGFALKATAGDEGQGLDGEAEYNVDVELWHRGTTNLALASVQEVDALLRTSGTANSRIVDRYVGDTLCLLRVRSTGATLSRLLDLQVVAEVDFPPRPDFDPVAAANVTARSYPDVPRPDPAGPRLCVLDSGIASNHPLIANNVGHASAVMSSTTVSADEHGHGTMVAGLSIFGSVRSCFEDGTFSSPIILFSARVLDRHNRFDNDKLIVNQIRDAITEFQAEPHNCRVFNLSLGTGAPAFTDGVERQTVWAESLDILARELKVLLVVSAGNRNEIFTTNTGQAEQVLRAYPNYLLEHSARINDPATAAIPITVGALAASDVMATRQGAGASDISRAVAKTGQPSPFTRLGHGINGAIKPEFVEYGGNAVFLGTGNTRRIGKEPGTAVMSFSHQPLQRLFAYDVGTSLAAPIVARNAALTWHRLRTVLEREPDPNLVRAVMATAASVPNQVLNLLHSEDDRYRVAGYGRVDIDVALDSSDRRVTLVAENRLRLDTFAIYSVPIPPSYVQAYGRKLIRVALAFDPPVRRRRMDYLGVEMTFQMIRGKTLEEVIDAYKQVGPDEEPEDAIGSPFKLDFRPKESPRNVGCRRKKSTLQLADFTFTKDASAYGDTYWLVVRSERKWAPPEIEAQDYAVAVVLSADDSELYNSVALRLQQRTRVRTRR
jgi:hypothetical protein